MHTSNDIITRADHKQWDSLWLAPQVATCARVTDLDRRYAQAIAVLDGKIVWLGPQTQLAEPLSQHAQHCVTVPTGHWLLPGLIDCHTHMVFAGERINEFVQRQNGIDYQTIAKNGGGIAATVKATQAASFAELLAQTRRRLLHWQSQGVTTLEIKSGYGLDLATEHKQLSVLKTLAAECALDIQKTYLAAHVVPPSYQGDQARYIAHVCETILPALHQDQLVDAVDGYCERIAFDTTSIETLFTAAAALHLPVKLHAEQFSDIGATPLAAKFQALSVDHVEYLSAAGVAALAASKTCAVLLPGAFHFLRETQCPPVAALRSQAVPMAVATDFNPGTSPLMSIVTAMNLACIDFNLTPTEALLGVTQHAAAALGLGDTHGSLAVGKWADFSIWAISQPEALCYYLGDNPCVATVKRGVPCYSSPFGSIYIKD